MKTKPAALAFLVAAAAAGAACQAAREPAPPPAKYTLSQLSARYYMDLGPATVDVSGYPARAQAGYEAFVNVCAQCHTTARALHGPETARAEWERRLHRMHEKTLVYGWWTEFEKSDARKIMDFLEHDAKVRKLGDPAGFAARTAELKALLTEVEAERSRRQLEEGRRDARPAAPYVGAKP